MCAGSSRSSRQPREMESSEIFEAFAGNQCAGCEGTKPRMRPFCKYCYAELPAALQRALWQTGEGFGQAYMAALSWFRTHPFQGEHRAKQKGLFE